MGAMLQSHAAPIFISGCCSVSALLRLNGFINWLHCELFLPCGSAGATLGD